MKRISLVFGSIALVLCSCGRHMKGSVTVMHDCTGSYLRLEGKDYHVCNKEKVAGYPNGWMVSATFVKLAECKADTGIVCKMYHENAGWVEIKKIE